jgi:hypothetical protein
MADLYVSASQLETKRTCQRKWWLDKVAKQPQEDKGYLEFGTVLHAVAERWMGADDRGCDDQGNPVELYPPGWEAQNDRGIPLPVDQQDLIRRLIDEAIKRGILRRSAGRQVEAKVQRNLAPGVIFTGKIDVLLPGGVEDHKSIGNWRYAETNDSLRRNDQLLLYCWALRELRKEQGLPPLDKYLVRHNQFGKDPLKPRVGYAEAWITDADIERIAFVARRDADHLTRLRDVKQWQDVPGAQREGGCQKYGGCPYLRICSGELDLDQHRALTESLNQDRLRTRIESSQNQAQRQQEVAVGSNALKEIMAARAARNAAAKPAGPAPEINSGVATAAPAAPAPAPAPTDVTNTGAPWADADCPACSKAGNLIRGVTAKGGACVVCDTRSKRAGRPTSSQFILTPGKQPGTITWTPRPGAGLTAPVTATVPSAPVVETASPAQEPAQPEEPAAEPDDLTEAEKAALSGVAPVADPPKRGPGRPRKVAAAPPKALPVGPPEKPVERVVSSTTGRPVGRPRKGFTLLIGCRMTRGGTNPEPTVYLSQILAQCCDAIAAASGVDFWALDAFKRRDALVSRASELGDELGTREVVCDSLDLIEARYLLDALRDQAGTIIEAVSR